MSIDVFISVGTTKNVQQEQFIQAIEQLLRDNGLNPRCVGRTDFPSVQPLKFIEQLMHQSSGTVIIALERIHIETGIERRNSEIAKPLSNINLATPWNQIEAAMAYVIGHPILVIMEQGLRSEGLLEPSYDWYIQSVDINPATLHSRQFSGVFADWKKRVEDYHTAQAQKATQHSLTLDPETLTVGQIVGSLKPAQLWGLIGTLVGALTAIAIAAYKLGTLSAPETGQLLNPQATIVKIETQQKI